MYLQEKKGITKAFKECAPSSACAPRKMNRDLFTQCAGVILCDMDIEGSSEQDHGSQAYTQKAALWHTTYALFLVDVILHKEKQWWITQNKNASSPSTAGPHYPWCFPCIVWVGFSSLSQPDSATIPIQNQVQFPCYMSYERKGRSIPLGL